MSEDNPQEKNKDKKPKESLEEFSKRVGLKYVREKGGMEFVPYHGPRRTLHVEEETGENEAEPIPEMQRMSKNEEQWIKICRRRGWIQYHLL